MSWLVNLGGLAVIALIVWWFWGDQLGLRNQDMDK